MRYKLLLIILLFGLTVACSPAGGEATAPAVTEPAATSEATATSEPAATPTSSVVESGIEGQALIGPMCPVVYENTECPDQPYQANVTIVDEGGREVTRLTTEADGRFRVVLAPGTYILRPETGKPFPTASEQTVTVRPGEFTEVIILYDNGIQ